MHLPISRVALALGLVLSTSHVAESTMSLFRVEAGHCMDGSPAAYYYREGKNSTTWMISLQGGGACYTKETCSARAKGHLGSSKNYAPTMQANRGWMSADPSVNPDFYDANVVYVPYCSSDTHRGQQTNTSAATWGYFFQFA